MTTSTPADSLSLLRSIDLFARVPRAELESLAARSRVIEVNEGTTLFHLGDAGDCMYVVLAGRVRISLPGDGGGEVTIAEPAPGGWFGEMSLLTGEARSATARTTAPSRLLCLTRTEFRGLVLRVPELAFHLSETLSRRLRGQMLRDLPCEPPRVLLLPDSDEPGGADAAVRIAIAIAREAGETVALVDLLDDDDVGIPPDSGVHPAAAPEDLGALLAMAAMELVVVRLPAGHAWLGKLATQGAARALPDAIANVMRAAVAPPALSPIVTDVDTQTARRFLGRRTALVLGAGGARGLAHIGVARALERSGFRVDVIVGTSMGGIVGGLIACGWGAERLDGAFREIARRFRRHVLDLGLRSGSIFKGEKKRRLLEAETAGVDIESLSVPFATIAADLTHAREHVIDRGPLSVALDATSAIPTLFPPVAVGDLRLVDGWITNPLPVDVARRLGADRVIAVDPCVDAEAPLPDPATVARPRFALFDASSLVRTAMRAMDVSARERAAVHRAEADVSIAPKLWHVSSTDVQRYAEIVEAGELAAEAALRATRSSG